MSVQMNTYYGIGIVFTWNEFKDFFSESEEGFDDFTGEYSDSAYEGITNKNGLTVLADGMSGEYVFVGHILNKTENWQGFEKVITIESDQAKMDMVFYLLKARLDKLTEIKRDQVKHRVISFYR